MEKQQIAKRLKDFRTKHIANSQMAAAVLIGTNNNTLSRYEAGKIGLNTDLIHLLIIVFKLNPLWLYTGEGSELLINED